MPDLKNKILLIDDEQDIVMEMKETLQDEGYDVNVAYNGLEGLEQIKKDVPDLILLDMNMPVMSGMEFYHKIFNTKKQRPIYPVLAVTARGDLESLFRDLNVDGFITKPFDVEGLTDAVNSIFTNRYGSKPGQDTEPVESPPPQKARSVFKPTNRILFVDEDSNLFGMMVTYFSNYGYDVLHKGSAIEAMESLIQRRVDAILVNLELNDLPGDILVFKLKQMPQTMDIPIILYSDKADDADITRDILGKIGADVPFLARDPKGLCDECHSMLIRLRRGES